MRSTTNSAALTRPAGSVRTHSTGALNGTVRSMLLSLVIAGGISSGSALARTVIIELAPPPARVEVVPVQRQGYTWAPGYWGWQRNRHVWVRGHTIRARSGYHDSRPWNQVDVRHEFQRGRWTRATSATGSNGSRFPSDRRCSVDSLCYKERRAFFIAAFGCLGCALLPPAPIFRIASTALPTPIRPLAASSKLSARSRRTSAFA